MGETSTREEKPFDRIDLIVWFLVALLALSRFINLGYGDLKDFDECLYAWRAKLVLFRGAWLDQSEYAWGGYWSAAFPPLQVWVTAIFFRLFGFSEFVARLYPALTGAGTVVILFLLGRRLNRDRWTGLLAALLIGSVWDFTVYSRRSQLDVPVAFYITLSIYAYVVYLDRARIAGRRTIEPERGAWRWLALSGLAVGLGLMNKIGQALTASIVIGHVGLYAWIRGRHPFRRLIVEQVVVNGVALAVVLPWHLAMHFWARSEGFWNWYFGYHLLARTKDTLHGDVGPWYYYLQRFYEELSPALMALSIAALAYSMFVILRSFGRRPDEPEAGWTDGERDRGRPLRHRDFRYWIPLFWFGFQLLLFSASGTKREPYAIPMYPPLCLLAAVFLGERLHDRRRLGLLSATLFVLLVVCTLSRMKSFGRQLEAAIANVQNLNLYGDVFLRLGLLIAGFLALTVALHFGLRRRPKVHHLLMTTLILIATTVFCLHEAERVFDPDKGTRRLGWQQIRPYLDRMDYDWLVFVGSYDDPEAMYYFNGLNPPFNLPSNIKFLNAEAYDEKLLDVLSSDKEVRVVVMGLWVERRWTREERIRLFDRLDLIKHSGIEFAIYRPKG